MARAWTGRRLNACWTLPADVSPRRSKRRKMDKFVIKGGRPLSGAIATSGSKNSALPALAAALLSSEPVTLRRIPKVRDIRTMQRLLVDVGAKVDVSADCVRIETPEITS